eukprot:13481-Heterococcus_DN1.PRE.1
MRQLAPIALKLKLQAISAGNIPVAHRYRARVHTTHSILENVTGKSWPYVACQPMLRLQQLLYTAQCCMTHTSSRNKCTASCSHNKGYQHCRRCSQSQHCVSTIQLNVSNYSGERHNLHLPSPTIATP